MAVIFKFETQYYERANIPVTFVGHPLADEVEITVSKQELSNTLGLSDNHKIVGLFPGSRVSEITRLLPTMLDTAQLLHQRDSSIQFILPVAAGLNRENIQQQCNAIDADITLSDTNIYDVIGSCDCIVSCSGTVTLEIGLLQTPLCIVYKMSAISYKIMSRLIKIPHIGLANIVAGKAIAKELLQNDATAENIAQEVDKMLNDNRYRDNMVEQLNTVRDNLGEGGGAANMSTLVASFIK